MIDLAIEGQPTGVPGVQAHGSFDKAVADAGGYCISLNVRTSVGRGTIVRPVRSVGASQRAPGRFYFAIDDRFRDWPGFGLVWPAPPEVTGVTAVPVHILKEPLQLSPQDVAESEETFREMEKIAEENVLPAPGEDQ